LRIEIFTNFQIVAAFAAFAVVVPRWPYGGLLQSIVGYPSIWKHNGLVGV
jgi:hypothetical protein